MPYGEGCRGVYVSAQYVESPFFSGKIPARYHSEARICGGHMILLLSALNGHFYKSSKFVAKIIGFFYIPPLYRRKIDIRIYQMHHKGIVKAKIEAQLSEESDTYKKKTTIQKGFCIVVKLHAKYG